MVDGCSRLAALVRVTLPLAAPGLVVAAIFAFLVSWNEFLFALILSGIRAKTLPVVIAPRSPDDRRDRWRVGSPESPARASDSVELDCSPVAAGELPRDVGRDQGLVQSALIGEAIEELAGDEEVVRLPRFARNARLRDEEQMGDVTAPRIVVDPGSQKRLPEVLPDLIDLPAVDARRG